jgi:hypothetical protein
MVPPRRLASSLSTRSLSHPPPRWPALLPGNRHAGFSLWLVPAVPDNAASVYVPMLLPSDNASAAILFPCFSLGRSSPKNPLDGNCLPPPLRQLALPEFFPPLVHSIVIAVPASFACDPLRQLAMLLALLFIQLSMLTPLDSPSSRSSLSPGFHSSGHGWPAGWTKPLQDRVNFATVLSLLPFPRPPLMHVRLPFSTPSVDCSSVFLFTPSPPRPGQLLQSPPSASTMARPQNRTSTSWRYRMKHGSKFGGGGGALVIPPIR